MLWSVKAQRERIAMNARVTKVSLVVLLGLFLAPAVVWSADIGPFRVSGYLRQYTSINLQDVPETTQDDAWDVSMNRWALFLDAGTTTGPLRWTVSRASSIPITYWRPNRSAARS